MPNAQKKLGLVAPKTKDMETEDDLSQPGVDRDGELSFKGTLVPGKYANLLADPYGDFNTRRDLKQRKKVASLKVKDDSKSSESMLFI